MFKRQRQDLLGERAAPFGDELRAVRAVGERDGARLRGGVSSMAAFCVGFILLSSAIAHPWLIIVKAAVLPSVNETLAF
ncbi:hypothetical protein E6W36_14555 [Hankyongella ginsenosidimutans]|uniref:Uncharacterized protein n=1 Tax=Hankyongella ginsenosidimutans TaxID=1763828 RepID=A0A4D7CAC3_9SPHN|nr:hypothetical protein [Hankyongella ginsenosidimutans]QCI80287.1 hypothetical protein E6W36_14555 [Hankyongella ginsenosidimutans]